MTAGRHRKPAPTRVHWATVAALVTLGGATALPAAAVLSTAGTATDASHTVRTTARPAAGGIERAVARTVSRSAARLSETELLAARLAAGEHRDPAATMPDPADLRPRWARTDLPVRDEPGATGRRLGALERADKVLATGQVRGGWTQVLRAGRLAWVRTDGLARSKPAPVRRATMAARTSGGAGPSGVSLAPCPDGSAVESGLTTNTIKVYRAVCAAFPSVSSWGGRSGSGDHGAGRALDIMVTGPTGFQIAEYVRAHAGRLGVSEVIWAQRIWTVQRAGEGWRAMENRGSTTANHYDHVHVSVY